MKLEPVAIPQELLDAIDSYAACSDDDDRSVVARRVVVEKLRQFRTIPEGYVVVPVEPTEEMIQAGGQTPKMKVVDDVLTLHQSRTGGLLEALEGGESALEQAYKAMIAAKAES